MTDNEIIQGAQYIALFMGWTPDEVRIYITVKYPQNGDLGKLSYHKSWDLLMPVVEKIQDMEGMSFAITPNLCTVQDFRHKTKPQVFSGEGKNIDAVYKAVLEFIKWYNTQNSGSVLTNLGK